MSTLSLSASSRFSHARPLRATPLVGTVPIVIWRAASHAPRLGRAASGINRDHRSHSRLLAGRVFGLRATDRRVLGSFHRGGLHELSSVDDRWSKALGMARVGHALSTLTARETCRGRIQKPRFSRCCRADCDAHRSETPRAQGRARVLCLAECHRRAKGHREHILSFRPLLSFAASR